MPISSISKSRSPLSAALSFMKKPQPSGKRPVDYHPSSLRLISRVHLFIINSMDSLLVYICPEYLYNFFSRLYILSWLGNSFKFLVLRLLQDSFMSQKIETIRFSSCLQVKLSTRFLPSPSRQKEITHFWFWSLHLSHFGFLFCCATI